MKMKTTDRNKKLFIAAFLTLFAFANLNAATAGNTASVLDNYILGLSLQQEESFYSASQYYLEVVAQNPAFTDAWFRLAECSYKLGEFDLALQYLDNAQKYEKNNTAIQNLRGMVLVSLGRIDEGRAIFNDILKNIRMM